MWDFMAPLPMRVRRKTFLQHTKIAFEGFSASLDVDFLEET